MLKRFAGIGEDRHLILSPFRLQLFRDVYDDVLISCPLKEGNVSARPRCLEPESPLQFTPAQALSPFQNF